VADLTRSYVLPVVIYSLAFCRYTAGQLHDLQRLIVAPLRRSLGLPKCACHASILAEYNLPSLTHLREALLLNFARQMAKLPMDHNTRYNFFQDYNSVEPACKVLSRRTMASEIKETETRLHTKHDSLPTKTITFATQNSYRAWRASGASRLLQSVRSPTASMPAYIKLDKNPTAQLRARLRFNLALLNYSINKRHIGAFFGVVDAKCTRCSLDTDETPEHVLLHCPAYANERKLAEQQLATLNIDLDLSVLLGEHTLKLEVPEQREVIRISGEFITEIHKQRKL